MYDNLDKALYRTKRRISEVCKELGIDLNDVSTEDMLMVQCVNCSIWGNKFTEMIEYEDDSYLCELCDDLDTLRF